MPSRRGKVKRTKTFTGCSTCRSRGVKCNEEKPVCLKCEKLNLECGGYGFQLVWPDSHEQRAPQRRVMLTGHEDSVPSLNEEQISSNLDAIDAATPSSDFSVGLFGVFRASAGTACSRIQMEDLSKGLSTFDMPSHALHIENKGSFAPSSLFEVSLSSINESDEVLKQRRRLNRLEVLEKLKWRLGMGYLEPTLYDSVPISSKEGRKLMDFWVGHLAPLMIPIERVDNPWSSIFMTMALSAPDDTRYCSGRKALLYSVYSLAAFARAGCFSTSSLCREVQRNAGVKYLELSFKQLSRSLVEANYDEPEIVLAAIVILAVIAMFTDNYSNYKAHIRGGVSWIRSNDYSVWKQNHNTSVIFQIFALLETMRPAHNSLAGGLEPQDLALCDLSLGGAAVDEALSQQDRIFFEGEATRGTAYYSLQDLFCITKPILLCIRQINRLVFGNTPTAGEIAALEFKIMANKPEHLHFSGLNTIPEQLSHHHACTIYFATYTYFKRALLRLPVTEVQDVVRDCVDRFDAMEGISHDQNLPGFLWPLFITACEAHDDDLRARIHRVYVKRQQLGLANVTTSKRVVDEVWMRRDQGCLDVDWHEVMSELRIDILLG